MLLLKLFELISKLFLLTGRLGVKNSFEKPLSPEEEKQCFIDFKKGSKDAEEKLIRHNLRLVAHISKKYRNNKDIDDLISVGSIGLMKAIRTFDTEKGNSFSTYSARCIENEILMMIRSEKKYISEVSLEDKIGTDKEGNEISLIEILSASEDSIYKQVEINILFSKLNEIIRDKLDEREQNIICMRFGLRGLAPITQKETAEILGISRSYISRIEKKSLLKIRAELKKRNIKID